jgi:hypothetical protein
VILAAKRMAVAIADVSPIAIRGETNDRKNILIIRRTEDMFQAKIRLCINYSVKIFIS